MTVLTATTSLADVFTFGFAVTKNCFAISHLGLTDVSFHRKLPFHSVNNDFEMELTPAPNNRLESFLISRHPESRIFLRKAVEGEAHFFLVGFGFWLNAKRHHRFRKNNSLKHYRFFFIAKSIRGDGVF